MFLTSMLAEFLVWTQVISYWTADLGLQLGEATNLYIIIGIVGIFSMPLMGIVADKAVARSSCEAQGRKKMLIFGPITGIVACAMLLLQTQTTFFLGAISCVIFAIYWAVVPGGVVGYAGAIYGRATLGKDMGSGNADRYGRRPLHRPADRRLPQGQHRKLHIFDYVRPCVLRSVSFACSQPAHDSRGQGFLYG